MANVAHAHPIDKDTIDKGLEREIGVHLQWITRGVVALAPHNKQVEFWELDGACRQCTQAKMAEQCWYPQERGGRDDA
ncbi:hypothetical protein C0991_010456 [Blastosporella zonata]|nr:hypothetical protein C0991_010456 [Blastosporella zonata]